MFSGVDLQEKPTAEDDSQSSLDEELSCLNNPSGSNELSQGILDPEIRERVYDTGYSSPESVNVCDQNQLEEDVRRAIYDLGNNPENWYDKIIGEVWSAAEDKNGNLSGEDIKKVLKKYRKESDEFVSGL